MPEHSSPVPQPRRQPARTGTTHAGTPCLADLAKLPPTVSVEAAARLLSAADAASRMSSSNAASPLPGSAPWPPLRRPRSRPAPRPRHRGRAGGLADGPTMSEHPPADAPTAASTAAEAIRALNHLTANHAGDQGIRDPGDLYATLGGLTALVQRLDQTTTQLGGWAANAARQGRIATPAAPDPRGALADAVGAMGDALQQAADSLRTAAGHLNTAWAASGQLVTAPMTERAALAAGVEQTHRTRHRPLIHGHPSGAAERRFARQSPRSNDRQTINGLVTEGGDQAVDLGFWSGAEGI